MKKKSVCYNEEQRFYLWPDRLHLRSSSWILLTLALAVRWKHFIMKVKWGVVHAHLSNMYECTILWNGVKGPAEPSAANQRGNTIFTATIWQQAFISTAMSCNNLDVFNSDYSVSCLKFLMNFSQPGIWILWCVCGGVGKPVVCDCGWILETSQKPKLN